VLAGGTGSEPDAPRQPVRARAEAVAPAAAGVELADQIEQARGSGIEVRRELGDLVAETVQFFGGRDGQHRRGQRGQRATGMVGGVHRLLSSSSAATLHRSFEGV
jgi:hypothetical protein